MTHDYKAALEWFNRANWNERVPEIHAIRHALLIADRVMGEPSEGMIKAGYNTGAPDGENWFCGPPLETFAAMRDQLIKEVTDNG